MRPKNQAVRIGRYRRPRALKIRQPPLLQEQGRRVAVLHQDEVHEQPARAPIPVHEGVDGLEAVMRDSGAQRWIDDIKIAQVLDLVARRVGEAGERRERRPPAADQILLHIAQSRGRVRIVARRAHFDQSERDVVEQQTIQRANPLADPKPERGEAEPVVGANGAQLRGWDQIQRGAEVAHDQINRASAVQRASATLRRRRSAVVRAESADHHAPSRLSLVHIVNRFAQKCAHQ